MKEYYPNVINTGIFISMGILKNKLLVVTILLLATTCTYGQINLSGKPGLMYTPSAVKTEDGLFRFGYNYNPMRYALRGRNKNPERILYANITIFSRLEININFLQMISSSRRKVKEGLGDRQLDLRYLILKENKNRPSLAVVITTPFTIDGAMLTHALVATKNFDITPSFKLETSVGYGSPYYLYRDANNLKDDGMFSNFKWQKKSEDRYKNHYLEGPFGGAILHYKKFAGVMAEYDSQHLNVGAYGKLFKNWTIQAGLINGDKLTFGTSYAILLTKPSKRLTRQNDENKR
jgi:hypothetical protein